MEYHGHRGRADFHKGTRRRHVIWCTTNADTGTELGLLCTHTRKSPRKRSSAAAASLQSWARHKCLSLVAHGPGQSSRFLLLFVECMGSGAVSTVSDIHFASHQTREAHSDASPSVLPTLAIRRIEHPRGPNECAPGEHPHRCVPHQLRFFSQHRPTKQAEVVGSRLNTFCVQCSQCHVRHVLAMVVTPHGLQQCSQSREAKGPASGGLEILVLGLHQDPLPTTCTRSQSSSHCRVRGVPI